MSRMLGRIVLIMCALPIAACGHVQGRAIIPVDCVKVPRKPERVEEPGTLPRSDAAGTLPEEDIARVIYENGFRLQQCYLARALREESPLSEPVRMRWTLSAKGDVEAVQVTASPVDATTQSCMAQCAAVWRFQPPAGGAAIVEREIAFAVNDGSRFRSKPYDTRALVDDPGVEGRALACIAEAHGTMKPLSDTWIVARIDADQIAEARPIRDGTQVQGFAQCLAAALVGAQAQHGYPGTHVLVRLYVRRSERSGYVFTRD